MEISKKCLFVIGLTTLIVPILSQQTGIRSRPESRRTNNNNGGKQCLKVDVKTKKCPDERITFTLYNRRLGREGFNISSPLQSMPMPFNSTDKLKVIVHGLIIEYMTPELYDIKNDYIKKFDCHVLFLHYEDLVDFNCYSDALENIKHVGKCVGELLAEFINQIGMKDIHVITYSLGGHVANYIAQAIRPQKIARITALDPPTLFVDKDLRLDPSDANFVDTIHTSVLSMGQSAGHARFIFNGGLIQSGCYLGTCSHSRVVEYFKESILSSEGFYGTPCESYFSYLVGSCRGPQIIAGEDCPVNARGLFFVNTNDKFPFAQGPRSRIATVNQSLRRRQKNQRDIY